VDPTDLSHRLSQIATRWTLVFQAHQDPGEPAAQARHALFLRYRRAIYRYLLAAVRDPDDADDLAQEFALRLVRGDFRRADPGRGRFRDYVKGALCHLIVDHHRRRRTGPLPPDVPEPAEDPPELPSEQEFLARWREGLLNRAWDDLAALEQQGGQPFYTALRRKADQPQIRSAELAEELHRRLGHAYTEAGARKLLQRARGRFADLLLAEVARSLERPGRAALEQELVELDLLAYCRDALDRFAPRT
jgi:RNA polymerase sigma-70 factor (ECF subfamily)